MVSLFVHQPILALIVILALAVLIGGGIGVGMIVMARSAGQARFRKRLAAIADAGEAQVVVRGKGAKGPPGAATRKKMVAAKLKELEEKNKGKQSRKAGLREMLQQAGFSMTPRQWIMVCVIMGLVGAVIALLMRMPPIVALFFAVIGGLGLPRWILKFVGKRRSSKFTSQFADAIDVIVRGIKSGLPLGECINIIGREMSDPVGIEFRLMTEGQKLGMQMDEILERTIQRVPTPDVKFFAIVLLIQQQTGGNLADTLGKLSDVLRGRKRMKDKIAALSSEAKSSAGIIGSLPFLMCLLLSLVNPAYIGLLFTDKIGHFLIGGGLAWMSIGVLVMRQMINFDI